MKREIIETSDGSKTIRIIDLDENYHSNHGALQEAEHVFIQNGLKYFQGKTDVEILEVGFGTGLNAFLTAIYGLENCQKISYTGIEAFPVAVEELELLEYQFLKGEKNSSIFSKIHQVEWNSWNEIHPYFRLNKLEEKIQNSLLKANTLDLVYFDAFGPRAQIEMWTTEIFNKLFEAIKPNGFLVTYCAKGQVKRDLKSVGFEIEPLPGPPGKREMTRAWKRL
ncbi:MAG: tRNA (5-methylaminomethyl-2-thiouridine)(34)-methyltransferase MnmD [Flavobacteriia bacterium]|nr:tRNA (5-methylaminomethyl-2-thiouridine)(34)-methyltransferase MnmD [Flavobacteriia bacterium]